MAVVRISDRPEVFHLRRNDRLPAYEVDVFDADTGSPVGLGGQTAIVFTLRAKDGTLKLNRVVATLIVGSDAVTLNRMRYAWAAGDTDTSGRYLAEFELSYGAPAQKRTFPADPDNQKLEILIHDDLDATA